MTKLTRCSEYLGLTFKEVVEHILGIALANDDQHSSAKAALAILLTIVKKATPSPIGATWLSGLLQRGAVEDMDHDTFLLLLKFSASRAPPLSKSYVHRQGSPGTVTSRAPTPEYTIFSAIVKHIKVCSEQEGGWQDEAVYGGLIAIRHIPHLGSCLPEDSFLEMLVDAMEKSKPLRVRQAAYEVIQAAQDGWLSSTNLCQTFERLDLPRQLYSVTVEVGDGNLRRSFLSMVEAMSRGGYWHSYLRGSMEIWLPFLDEESTQVLSILIAVAGIPVPEGPPDLPLNIPLTKLVEKEWAAVPGRPVESLTIDRLKPLVEVTERLNELLFDEADRRAVLVVVEQVVPSLEKRCDDGYHGPGDDVREVIGGLLESLHSRPLSSVSR